MEEEEKKQATTPNKIHAIPLFCSIVFIGYFYQTFMKLKSNRMNHKEKGGGELVVANSNKS